MKDLDLYVKFLSNNELKEEYAEISCKPLITVKDKFIYTKVFIRGFKKSYWKFPIFYMNCFDSHYDMYLITLNDKIIGCFALRFKGHKSVYLYDFTILDKYRGKGYSKMVLQMIYNISLERGKRKLYLYLRKKNEIALRLYESEGFVKFSKNRK